MFWVSEMAKHKTLNELADSQTRGKKVKSMLICEAH